MTEKGAGKARRFVGRFKGVQRALEAILFVWGLAGLAGSTWAGLDPGARGWIIAASLIAVAAGGSALLYTGLRSLERRRAPAQAAPAPQDRRAERIARLVDELKAHAGRFNERVSEQQDFGLYNLVMNHGGGELPGLYARVHVNGYGPVREDIAGFVYAPGRERDLVSLARNFEAHVDSHGEFVDRFLEALTRGAKGQDPGLLARATVCVEDYNHFVSHLRLWQTELALLVGADAYSPRYLRPRAPPRP